MKDMGSKGWKLVSVSSNPVNESHVFFWKRSQSQDANKNDITAYSETKKLKERNSILNVRKHQHEAIASTVSNKFYQEIIESNYKNFPVPQVVMVVKYRPKEGYFEQFRKELYGRDYPNVIARHMGFNKQNEFVCVSLMESIDATLDLEGVGTS